jgi:PAS domain S-box-containing protein
MIPYDPPLAGGLANSPGPVAGLGVVQSTSSSPSETRTNSLPRSDSDGAPPTPRGGNRFVRDRDAPGLMPIGSRSASTSPLRLPMPYITPGQLAFTAMQYLPVPILVLNNLKTIVLANGAMGRLLGIGDDDDGSGADNSLQAMDRLRGQSLSQAGIDMLQDGRPVWVSWEQFLDSLAHDTGLRQDIDDISKVQQGDMTPKIDDSSSRFGSPATPDVQDAVLEVIISKKSFKRTTFSAREKSRETEHQVYAKMIVTVWGIEHNQIYFTLTFTSTQSAPLTRPNKRVSMARPGILEAAERKSISTSNPASTSSSHESGSPSYRVSPSAVSLSSSPFPPMGPPSKSLHTSTPSILQKMILMKDALLDNTQMPILAMWKDGSVTFPNKAARRLFHKDADLNRGDDGFDLLLNWHVFTEDFSRKLELSEYPISVILRTEQPFSSIRIGMYDADGRKIVFDVLGEAIRDEETGEFLAGVITCRDVTQMTEEITQIREQDAERFKLICDTMPQLVWTTTPDGLHDFFNTRWYHYTGLTPETSLGLAWQNPFHPDDMPETMRRWSYSLKTGEPYVTEYRCRSRDGEWRWFLGRALPLKNKHTGEIEKWFGTCTDVNESIEAKLSAKRTRQQLLSVVAHAHVTIFTVDANRKVTMLEGALIWDAAGDEEIEGDHGRGWYVGENMYEVFNRLNPELGPGERPEFLQPIEEILAGTLSEGFKQHRIGKRYFLTSYELLLTRIYFRGPVVSNPVPPHPR